MGVQPASHVDILSPRVTDGGDGLQIGKLMRMKTNSREQRMVSGHSACCLLMVNNFLSPKGSLIKLAQDKG